MRKKSILILDYSVDRSETPAIKQWLPKDSEISSLFIDTEESFPDDLFNEHHTHIIHTGSALSITEPAPFTRKTVDYIQRIRDKGVSQMGICFGHQLICRALVGKHAVRQSPNGFEAGWKNVLFKNSSVKIPGVGENEIIWQHHFDEVINLPEGSELLASNPHTPVQAYINFDQRLFGTQFHPECDRKTGNEWYLKDRELLEKHHYNVDEMIKQGPSLEAGKTFFGFFLECFGN